MNTFILLAAAALASEPTSFDASQFTDAPLKVQFTADLDAPPSEVFELVSTRLHDWMDVSEITWDNTGSETDGAIDDGSSRSCSVKGKALTEQIHYWEQDRVYAYQIDFDESELKLPLNGQLGVFEVTPNGQGGSTLVWSQYFQRRFHPMSPMIPGFMRKTMGNGLHNLIEITGGSVLGS